MAVCKVTIGGRAVELRRTLATLRRIKEATGQHAAVWGKQVEKGEVDEGEALAVTLWSMVAHDPEFSRLSLDELAALVDMDDVEEIARSIKAAWDGSGPPPVARGRKARAPRQK